MCLLGDIDMQNKKVFPMIGELTLQFATLEHRLQGLLEILIGEENILVGPLFIHNLTLAMLLRKIRVVAQCKIQEDKPLLQELERTIKRIDTIREVRNLLIHGDWHIADTDSLPITVRDFKMRYENGNWQEFTETSFTEKKLAGLIRRLNGLAYEVEHRLNAPQNAPNNINESS
jgi:hypothetical protein